MADVQVRWIAGRHEMAALLHVNAETFRSWSLRSEQSTGCPTPIKWLGMGPIWDAEAVIKWWLDWNPIKAKDPGKLGYVDSEILEELGISSNGQTKD